MQVIKCRFAFFLFNLYLITTPDASQMESSLSKTYLVYRMRLGLYSLHLALLVASGGCEVGSSAIAPENSEIGPHRTLR